MSGEKDLEQLKKEAAAKAREAALEKKKAMKAAEAGSQAEDKIPTVAAGEDDLDLAKKKQQRLQRQSRSTGQNESERTSRHKQRF